MHYDKYYRFDYLIHVPHQELKSGVDYMKRKSFDPNLAKEHVRQKVLKGTGEVTLVRHVEITKEEYELNTESDS